MTNNAMNKINVLIADGMSEAALAQISQDESFEVDFREGLGKEQAAQALMESDIVLVRSATQLSAELIAECPRLKGILRAGVGVDNIDLEAASLAGIHVWNAPQANFQAAAEMAIALLCSLARQIPQATAAARQLDWQKKALSARGRSLAGSTLGIYGAGNIGLRVAQMAQGLGMKVQLCDPRRDPNSRFSYVDFDELLASSDFISIHSPLLESTAGVFGSKAFAAMKKSALLINVARGGIVDEEALLEALEREDIEGAALDVFDHEPWPKDSALYGKLLAHPRVIATAHMGASTREAQHALGFECVEKLRMISRALKGESKAPRPINTAQSPRWRLNFV